MINQAAAPKTQAGNTPQPLPKWAHSLALRLSATVTQPGSYSFTIIAQRNGKRVLTVSAPAPLEHLGSDHT